MALSPEAEQQLNALAESLSRPSHHSAEDFRKPVRVFIARYQAGDEASLYPDAIRDWATAHGWSEADARDLGEMAEIVRATLSELAR
jgi:hypothetical protein